ncbi:MAG: cobalamin B12-binding domain-containing protein, partial [Coriobacteriales bacterium]
DVKSEVFVNYVKENPDCHLVLASALLTTTMPKLKEVVQAFVDAGLRDDVKIMVGGAHVTQEFADEIGADAYTPDGGSCANKAAEILTEWNATH